MEDSTSLGDAVIEQMADAVVYADRSGTIRRWNPAAAALFGYSAAEAPRVSRLHEQTPFTSRSGAH